MYSAADMHLSWKENGVMISNSRPVAFSVTGHESVSSVVELATGVLEMGRNNPIA